MKHETLADKKITFLLIIIVALAVALMISLGPPIHITIGNTPAPEVHQPGPIYVQATHTAIPTSTPRPTNTVAIATAIVPYGGALPTWTPVPPPTYTPYPTPTQVPPTPRPKFEIRLTNDTSLGFSW